jgi:hypothetical protein
VTDCASPVARAMSVRKTVAPRATPAAIVACAAESARGTASRGGGLGDGRAHHPDRLLDPLQPQGTAVDDEQRGPRGRPDRPENGELGQRGRHTARGGSPGRRGDRLRSGRLRSTSGFAVASTPAGGIHRLDGRDRARSHRHPGPGDGTSVTAFPGHSVVDCGQQPEHGCRKLRCRTSGVAVVRRQRA